MSKSITTVDKIKDTCSVFKGGGKIVIKNTEIDLENTDKIYVHALIPTLQYASVLKCQINPKNLGLSKIQS